ncbi:MAG TPA: citramalate synthase [Gemmatimonadales bacterium]|nr:citramalate synthase [Gemmatimonadales bacterium]
MSIVLYDTTLRDGTQRAGLSLSAEDKRKIAQRLDDLGIHYIEGGWPGSNPKDAEFFRRMERTPLVHAKLAAFGSTRRAGIRCADDGNIQALAQADTPVVTLVGKSSVLHVERVLETSREENVAMISDSVAYFKGLGREVVYDAEHFFDGYALDPAYALATIAAAAEAGADCVVLCDTNGGSLPNAVADAVRAAHRRLRTPPGIHTHNDTGLALANALAAIAAGCTHVQGTINGYGERCGNLDLIPLIATLQLKLGYALLPAERLRQLTDVAHAVAAVANVNLDPHAPYVGRHAFTHKGGLHAAAVAKLPQSYQHVDPGLVGNELRVVVSELAGRGNVRLRAQALGLDGGGDEDRERAVVQRLKELESHGYQFEGAEGSFEMLLRRTAPDYLPPFETVGFIVTSEKQGSRTRAQARVDLRVGSAIWHGVADGQGPVNALDRAARQALRHEYPELAELRLLDYKVRIVDEHLGTAAKPRVLIESAWGRERWTTVGCSENIIEASWEALSDALELALTHRRGRGPAPEGQRAESDAGAVS